MTKPTTKAKAPAPPARPIKLADASGIPVFCSHDALVDVTALVPNPRNPNKHPDKQVALLAKIIRAQGWRNPIVVSTRSGFITKGHGRLAAAQVLQVQLVPVDYQDYPTEAAEWADMIADNRIAELAETDNSILTDVLVELDTGAFDMDLTGFDKEAMEFLMTATSVPGENKPIDEAGMANTANECPKCGFKW